MSNQESQSDPQRVPILRHLKRYQGLTGLQAWNLYGVYRLSSVIKRLRKAGKDIKTIMVPGERYCEYQLIKSK